MILSKVTVHKDVKLWMIAVMQHEETQVLAKNHLLTIRTKIHLQTKKWNDTDRVRSELEILFQQMKTRSMGLSLTQLNSG